MMRSTQEQRTEFPEFIVDNTTTPKPLTDTSSGIRVALPVDWNPLTRVDFFLVHPDTRSAWEWLKIVFDFYDYEISTRLASGTFNDRYIGSNVARGTSLHAHGIALDTLPGPSDEMTRSIEAIRTISGAQVFRVLHKDESPPSRNHHIEINCTKNDLRSGPDWSTIRGAGEDPLMLTSRSNRLVIQDLQTMLNMVPVTIVLKVDGVWGPNTRASVTEALGKLNIVSAGTSVSVVELALLAMLVHRHGIPPDRNTTKGKP